MARPFAVIGLMLASVAGLHAQTGPFSSSDWPPTIDTNAIVDYVIFDPNANFNSPSAWSNVLLWDNCCDQTYTTITLAGLLGDQATSGNINIADPNYVNFANTPVIDILMQVYGNSVLYTGTNGDSVGFLEGQLNFLTTASAGDVPPGADNGQWNWMLFEITNSIDPATSNRYVGDTSYPQQVNGQYGGVNGGTLRLQGIGAGMTIRAVAFGPQGAFGTSNQVNVFAAGTACAPEPAVNLAYIDFNQKLTNNLTVINDTSLGETYTNESGVGPAGDLRTAIQSTSGLMNFGILSNYLGLPCNTPRTMELGIEFYDDPALAGGSFGPAQYASDSQGDLQTYAGTPYTLTGTGEWLKVAFYLAAVDLEGVDTAPLTGGPTLAINGTAPFIDRIEIGVVRAGTNALAGLTPDPTYFMNPLICETNYGYYAEWAPYLGITNNLTSGAPGGGDQNMVLTNAGPADDQRLSEAPAPGSGNNNLQFPLLNNVFGPTYQDNADVAIEMTYYDDPALVGATLYPQVYQSWVGGVSTITFPVAPYNARAVLQGTGNWQDAYFELPNVNFNGVNANYSVVRFETGSIPGTNAPAVVYVCRVRFDVIRPCGPFEGVDYLQTLGITTTNTSVNVNWRGTSTLQAASAVTGPYSNAVTVTNILTNSYTPSPSNNAQFFRLQYPGYPSYLSTSPIYNTP
ncbi:MAG TPA: hypothetical protein VGR14_00420 [Verrucomicrobiae bacterium]|nr:hypothetical protein [Verrucomicrobiae bacterium]